MLLVHLGLQGLASRHVAHGGIAEDGARTARLGQAGGLSCQGNMAFVCREDRVVGVVGGTHAELGWGRSKPARSQGSFVGQGRILQPLQVERRKLLSWVLPVATRKVRRRG